MNRVLKLKGVGKRFHDFWAVREVSVKFLPGEITALIGPNGAGKTTLFHLITGELVPEEGDIFYGDVSIKGWPPWKVAREGIGRLFQDVRIFQGLTVLENVFVPLFGPKEEIPGKPVLKKRKEKKEKAMDWLAWAGLAEIKDKKAEELSFGQQKLLALARLMAGNFDLLLLDEPLAGISGKMLSQILKLLQDLKENYGKTLVVIEHNITAIKEVVNWVYFMNEGRIQFAGRTDHVLGSEEVKRIYLGW